MAMANVRLCAVVEGVEADLAAGSIHFRLVAPESFLRERFRADDTPQGWLAAFELNEAEIAREALEHFSSRPASIVVLGARRAGD